MGDIFSVDFLDCVAGAHSGGLRYPASVHSHHKKSLLHVFEVSIFLQKYLSVFFGSAVQAVKGCTRERERTREIFCERERDLSSKREDTEFHLFGEHRGGTEKSRICFLHCSERYIFTEHPL